MNNFLLFTIFLAWGAALTPLSIELAYHYGLMDRPDNRKMHKNPVPRGAGLVLWTGFLFWVLLMAPELVVLKIMATGVTAIFLVGYLDDMVSMSPYVRLFVQFAAAIAVAWYLFDGRWFYVVIFSVWIAGTTNAYNLIDGMNGLSLFMSIISFAMMAIFFRTPLPLPVLGMAIGILPWNFPRAQTFMGDSGVYILGFLSASMYAYFLSLDTPGVFSIVPVLVFLGGVPVIDTLYAIIRRLLHGKSPFKPDRGHIHHRLVDNNVNHKLSIFLLALFQALLTGVGLLLL